MEHSESINANSLECLRNMTMTLEPTKVMPLSE